MLSHDHIWRGIDRLAQSFGYSPSGLAKKAGLDPTSFNKSKRVSPDGKPRWPTTESIAKILSVTGATMSDFISLIDPDADDAPKKPQQTIPVIGFAQAGRKGFFDEDGYPAGDSWDSVAFPHAASKMDSRALFAISVTGKSIEPLYRPGDLLIVCPGVRVRRGDRVVVRTTDGEVMVKELAGQNAKQLRLKSLNPSFDDEVIPSGKIGWMSRILWVSQ